MTQRLKNGIQENLNFLLTRILAELRLGWEKDLSEGNRRQILDYITEHAGTIHGFVTLEVLEAWGRKIELDSQPRKAYHITHRPTGQQETVYHAASAQEACSHLGWMIGDCFVEEGGG